jgi:hypothetical protein
MAEKIYATFTTSAGVEVKVTVSGRRRYGNTMMTWLYCGTNENDQQFMGDPWPMIHPPISGLLWQLRCMGYDIPPTKNALEYARKNRAEKRLTQITQEDIDRYLSDQHRPTNPITTLLATPVVARFLQPRTPSLS